METTINRTDGHTVQGRVREVMGYGAYVSISVNDRGVYYRRFENVEKARTEMMIVIDAICHTLNTVN